MYWNNAVQNNKIGIQIKKYRKELKLTQEELAKKADIPYATLIKIENGHVDNPTIQTLMKIANALQVNIDNLVN